MKIGIVAPTLHMFIEKYAALFHPDPIVIFTDPMYTDWNQTSRNFYKGFWEPLHLNIELREAPYTNWDFRDIDVLIETAECFQYGEKWKDFCLRIPCPILFKVCFINDMKRFPTAYHNKICRFPVIVEAPYQLEYWKSKGINANLIYNPTGFWWFDKEWLGDKKQVIFVVAGVHRWRGDALGIGWDWWQEIEKRFPGKFYHHDSAELGGMPPLQFVDMIRSNRVFVNLDWNSGRPLSTAFSEALSIGMPVVVRDCQSLNYRNFIRGNGIASNSLDEIFRFIDRCFSDYEFAKSCSQKSREIAIEHFHTNINREKINRLIDLARQVKK